MLRKFSIVARTLGRSLGWISLFSIVCAASSGAPAQQPEFRPEGVQNFSEEAPADVFEGPIVIQGQVIHRALDGSWLHLKAQSLWGTFLYQVTRLGVDSSTLKRAPDTPAKPPEAVAARDTKWDAIQSSGSQARLWLEGVITKTINQGFEMEGRFLFSGQVLRLHFRLIENNPLGADPLPTYRNVYYGPHVRQKMDVYLAKSPAPAPVAVYIHGGAWMTGDKTTLSGQRAFLDAGITVVAIDYRYIPKENPDATMPAVAVPLSDAARAIQFIRSKAAEWGLDKNRIGVWGRSAGAFSALWLATHSDLADPNSKDPVLCESTRPTCVAAILAQTSLDPVEMRAWVGPALNYGAHAFAISGQVTGGKTFDAFVEARERLLPWINAYSPAALLGPGAAPIFLDYVYFSLIPCEPLDAYFTHSPAFGTGFKRRANQVGAECYLRYDGSEDTTYAGWESFLIQKLKTESSS